MAFDEIFGALEGLYAATEIREKIRKEIAAVAAGNNKVEAILVLTYDGLPVASVPEDKFGEASPIFPSISVVYSTSERTLEQAIGEVVASVAVSKDKLLVASGAGEFIIAVIVKGRDLLGALELLNKLSARVADIARGV